MFKLIKTIPDWTNIKITSLRFRQLGSEKMILTD